MNSTTYIELGFWQKLQSDSSKEGIRSQLEISDVLEDSKVITDIPIELIQQDEFLQNLLLKEQQPTPCDTNYISKKVNGLNNDSSIEDLCATYMLASTATACNYIEKEFGVIALCAESIHNRRNLFVGDGIDMYRNIPYPHRYDSFKDKLANPCNSIIIIDPYIIKKKMVDSEGCVSFPGLTNNMESLLDAIIPNQLKIDFHLTIISSLDNPDDIKRAYEKFKKCLKRIKKELSFKLCIVYTETGYNPDIESFHSRHVLSNTFSIDSEDGLDIFDGRGYITKNNPVISIVFPRLLGDCRKDFTKSINWIASVKKHIQEAPDKFICGVKDNRLFDLVD